MKQVIACLSLLALAACGGGGSTPVASDPTPTPPVVQAYSGPAGYYTFSNSSTGESGHLVVAPDGSIFFDENQNNCYTLAYGSLTLGSYQYTGSATLSPQGGCAAPQVLPLSGDWILQSEIDMYGQDGSDVEWDYNEAVSVQPAELQTLAGKYQFSDGTNLTINVDGSLTATDFACTITGDVTIPNSGVNVYELTFRFSGCTGENANLNGITGKGLFSLDSNDNQLVGGVAAIVGGNTVVLFGTAELM